MKILLVDDDAVDRETVKRALKNDAIAHDVIEAETAVQGFAELERQHFDVILLDYFMPKVDGMEMVIELRGRQDLGETAIIMMSTSSDESLALESLQSGAQDFLSKEEISTTRLRRSILQAQKRFSLEQRLRDSYRQVRELAERDPLTGLANRYHFEESLKTSVLLHERSAKGVALLLLDLDHFKYVNDNYGHDVGDELLKSVVKNIETCLRDNEVFARLGGDEFAIVLSDVEDPKEATLVARRILNKLSNSITVNNIEINCGVSIGIALYPLNASSAEELIKFSDIAMYRAKKLGRNQLCFFESAMQQQFTRNYQLELDIKEALKHTQFALFYQPVIDCKSGALNGFEALLRWPGTDYFPDEFIPVAEESRLIGTLGQWVIETAIEQISHWQKRYNRSLKMAINLSPVQLKDTQLCRLIEATLKQHGVSAESLILELTETALLTNDESNTLQIQRLSDIGCHIALDDFGTGFSSLSHLVNFPISIVKLDKSMLPTEDSHPRLVAIAKGIASMVGLIGLDIIAEGVETEYQHLFCQKLAINELQGYYFARPASAKEVEKNWLQPKSV